MRGTYHVAVLVPVVVPTDVIPLSSQLVVTAATPTDLLLDDQDEGDFLLALRIGELDYGRGDDDIINVVPIISIVSVAPIAVIIPVVLIVPVVPIGVIIPVVVATSDYNYIPGFK